MASAEDVVDDVVVVIVIDVAVGYDDVGVT